MDTVLPRIHSSNSAQERRKGKEGGLRRRSRRGQREGRRREARWKRGGREGKRVDMDMI